MSIITSKCENCGAMISVDDENETYVCEYCGASFANERYSENAQPQIINNYYAAPGAQRGPSVVAQDRPVPVAPPRPRLNGVGVFFGLLFYIFPGLIYIYCVQKKQREWDRKYASYKFQD